MKFNPTCNPIRTGLPDALKAGVEALSGMAMDNVQVHYNAPKPAQLQAHAFAQGSDIHVTQGQDGHAPHEAWYVVQQAQGRVQPTVQMSDGEPAAMGTKALDDASPPTGSAPAASERT